MVARWLALAVCLAGCDKLFGLGVVTTDPSDAPSDDRPDAAQLTCPASYDLDVVGSTSRYRYEPTGTTWDAALIACTNDSPIAHLVVLDDDDERIGLVGALAAKKMTMTSVWIGLSDRVTEDTFLWVTAQPVGMPQRENPPWPAGQPDDMGGQDCVRIQGMTWEAPTLFDDGQCSSIFDYVCECDGYAPAPANY